MHVTQNIEFKFAWKNEYLKWMCRFDNELGGPLYGIKETQAILISHCPRASNGMKKVIVKNNGMSLDDKNDQLVSKAKIKRVDSPILGCIVINIFIAVCHGHTSEWPSAFSLGRYIV